MPVYALRDTVQPPQKNLLAIFLEMQFWCIFCEPLHKTLPCQTLAPANSALEDACFRFPVPFTPPPGPCRVRGCVIKKNTLYNKELVSKKCRAVPGTALCRAGQEAFGHRPRACPDAPPTAMYPPPGPAISASVTWSCPSPGPLYQVLPPLSPALVPQPLSPARSCHPCPRHPALSSLPCRRASTISTFNFALPEPPAPARPAAEKPVPKQPIKAVTVCYSEKKLRHFYPACPAPAVPAPSPICSPVTA